MSHCGSSEFHKVVESKAHAFSNYLIAHRTSTKYDVHGLFGIFARGDRVANSSKRYFLDYGGTKTSFLLEWACKSAKSASVNTICEVGFCAGLSALLLMEAAPDAKLVSFDLGDLPWSQYANKQLQKMYSKKRFPGVIYGDAATTIPIAMKTHKLHCDMVFVDGDKSFSGRLQSLYNLKNASAPGAIVFMDEVTSKECVDGSIPEASLYARCASMNRGYWPSVRAYNVAAREGWLHVERCAWPVAVRADGICMGYFL